MTAVDLAALHAPTKRRVAMISEHASPLASLGGVDGGGQNVYVAELSRRLAALGHSVDVYTRRDDETLETEVQWLPGVRVIHVPAGPAEPVAKEALWRHMGEFTEWFVARAARESYDIVHANFWMSAAVAVQAKRELGLPFVVTFHALGKVRRQHQGANDGFPETREAVEDEAVRAADRIIAECPQDEQDLIQLYDAPPESLSLVPCGVTTEEFHPINRRLARRKLGIDPDEHVLLSLGRMVPRKGVDTVIRAVRILRERHDFECRLLIVGGESATPDPERTPEIGRLMDVAAEAGVSDLVTFVGARPRDELKFYYSAADVFVTVPWYEPFGMTPLEAMACGTPVIGAGVGGIKFSVRDGETGYLVPPKDPAAVADRVIALKNNPRLIDFFSTQGLRRAHDLFGWERVAEMMADVYEQALERSRREVISADTAAIGRGFKELVDVLVSAQAALAGGISLAAMKLGDTLLNGGTVLIVGNGGSASQAQHLATEFVGRFKRPGRRALAAQALCTDTAVLTAWANDMSYDDVFARQVEAFGRPGDLLVGFSTSGNSPNVVRALEEAKRRGVGTLALLGGSGGEMRRIADDSLIVPSKDTQRVQEVHALLIHLLVELVEERIVRVEGTSLEGVQDTGRRSRPEPIREAAPAKGNPA